MPFRLFMGVLCYFAMVIPSLAQDYKISGYVLTPEGEKLPNVTIGVIGERAGTHTNGEGYYELWLAGGEHRIQFQYLGYALEMKGVVLNGDQRLDVKMQEQVITLTGINIRANTEDPAYYIMRKAIGMAQYYKRLVKSYEVKAYTKGSGIVKKVPKLLKMAMDDEEVERFINKQLVMESVSEVKFSQPNTYEQKVLSYRTSIPDADNQVDPMEFVTASLYDDQTADFISPLSRMAFRYYKFEYEGLFEDRGMQVNKIKVIPKQKGQQYYRGHIFIVEDAWFLHSTDLTVALSVGDIRVKQLYAPETDQIWMPKSLEFSGDLSVVGVKMSFNYLAALSDYEIVPDADIQAQIQQVLPKPVLVKEQEEVASASEEAQLNKNESKIQDLMAQDNLSNREMRKLQRLVEKEAKKEEERPPLEIKSGVKVDSLATKKNDDYWNTIRPVSLTSAELESFSEKDSVEAITSTPAYKDSVKAAQMKFHLKDIILGGNYRYPDNNSVLNYHGILKGIHYNTVDGIKLFSGIDWTKNYEDGSRIYLQADYGFTFSRGAFLGDLLFRHHYAPQRFGKYQIAVGQWTQDFNASGGMFEFENDISTLFFGLNYLKIYEKQYFKIDHDYELVNGLMLKIGYEFQNRHALQNTTTNTLFEKSRTEITDNKPLVVGREEEEMFDHQVNIVALQLDYTPRHRYYYSKKGVKRHVRSKYPTIGLHYKKGFSTDIDYDFLSLGVNQQVDLGFLDSFKYGVKAGAFLNNSKMSLADLYYSNTRHFELMISNVDEAFRLLPYYKYGMDDYFVEGHFHYTSQRLLLKRLPLLNKSLISENIGFHYMKNPQLNHYMEVTYGLRQILGLISVEGVMGFEAGEKPSCGWRLVLDVL
ncbi:DUF5686 family protein [Persicobacter diffluens]